MENTKSPFKSLGVLAGGVGTLVSTAALLLSAFRLIELSPGEQEAITGAIDGLITAAITLYTSLAGVWGRIRAKDRIEL